MFIAATESLNDVLALLMLRVQAGDEDAFARVYDETSGRISQVVAQTLRVPEHSAEVVQDVYLYAWEHACSFDPARGTLMGWLATIARRRAVDRIRGVVRAAARDHRDAAYQETVTPDVAELGLAHLEAAQLHAALRRLSAKQREAVVVTYLHGWSFPQAAERLGLPVGTLKTRARDGLARLRLDYASTVEAA